MTKRNLSRGQTLVVLLVFMTVAIIITSATVIIVLANSQAISQETQGTTALDIAESGVENGLLRVLRDPAYTGETLAVGTGTASISAAPGFNFPKTLTSQGTLANFSRTVQATIGYNNNVLSVLSWKEINP